MERGCHGFNGLDRLESLGSELCDTSDPCSILGSSASPFAGSTSPSRLKLNLPRLKPGVSQCRPFPSRLKLNLPRLKPGVSQCRPFPSRLKLNLPRLKPGVSQCRTFPC